jgi:hypothetical protein
MLARLRPRVPSLPTAISLLAVSIALGGTAYAATGQFVNIVDKTTTANVAKVNSAGWLSANISGSVTELPPKTPFSVNGLSFTDNFFTGQFAATGATIALTDLRIANGTSVGTTISVYQFPQTTTSCGETSGAKFVGQWVVPAGQTLVEELSTPLMLKPLSSGGLWCLGTYANGGGGTGFWMNYNGYVVSGTFAAAGAPAQNAPARGKADITRADTR